MNVYRHRQKDGLDAHKRPQAAPARGQAEPTPPGNERAEALLSPARRRLSVTHNWVNLSVLLLLIGLVLRQYSLFVLPIFLLVTIGAAAWWNSRALRGVSYVRRTTRTRAFPGETLEIDIQVENAKFLPVAWLRVEDTWPEKRNRYGRFETRLPGAGSMRDQGNERAIGVSGWHADHHRRPHLRSHTEIDQPDLAPTRRCH